jgi:hypothetical protein
MSKSRGPQDLDSHKSSKSKFTKSTLALAGAGVLAGALGGGKALAADRSDDDLNSPSLPPAGHSSVSPSSLQAAYKGVQDTMNWCSENPYTTAGIVFGAIAAVAIGVYGADIYDGATDIYAVAYRNLANYHHINSNDMYWDLQLDHKWSEAAADQVGTVVKYLNDFNDFFYPPQPYKKSRLWSLMRDFMDIKPSLESYYAGDFSYYTNGVSCFENYYDNIANLPPTCTAQPWWLLEE